MGGMHGKRGAAARIGALAAKDLGRLGSFIAMAVLMNLYFVLTRDHLDTAAVLLMSGWIFAVGVGPAVGIESNEARYGGYFLLLSLPVRRREILLGRLMPVLSLAAAYALSAWVYFGASSPDPALTALARKWLVFNLSAYLVLVGAVYLVRYRYGYGPAVFIKLAVMVLAFVLPVLLNEVIIRRSVLPGGLLDAIEGCSAATCAAWLAVSIAAGAALAAAAIRAFEREARE